MSVIFNDTKREVVPRWLDYQTACSLSLLKSNREQRPGSILEEQHSRVLHEWVDNPNTATAVELIAEAIIIKDFTSVDAINAANYILRNASSSYPLHRELATYFLNQSATNLSRPSLEFKDIDRSKCIANLRQNTREYSYNALAWSDLSLYYAGSGHSEKARRAAAVALGLGKSNRFILRNVSHCFMYLGEPDRAVYILRHSELGNIDPWITSAEIAISESAGLKSKLIDYARDLTANDNLTYFARSELAAELGTIEYKNASTKKAKKLMKLALQDPSENALAQVEWFGRHSHSGIHISNIDVEAPYEAETWHYYFDKKFKDSLKASKLWACFQPLSSLPVIQSSFLAITCLNDNKEAISIIENSLPVIRQNPTLINNYAVALAKLNKIEQAEQKLRCIDIDELSLHENLVLTATWGMISYKKSDPKYGEILYKQAIEGFERNEEPTSAAIAAYFWALEEKRIGSPNAEVRIKDAQKRIKRFGVFTLEDLVNQL